LIKVSEDSGFSLVFKRKP